MLNQHDQENRNGHLLKNDLKEAYLDFQLSKQAMLCKETTLDFYKFTTGKFVEWLDIQTPQELTSRHVRVYLADLANRKLSDTTIHCHARAIRTLVKFLYKENYIDEPITFPMPSLSNKRLTVLSKEDIHKAIKGCTNVRDKAILLLMIDSGIRRREVCDLNWGDVNLMNGVVRIANGKGGKARSVVIGIKTRRALLAYRRQVSPADDSPLFQTIHGSRLTPFGLRSIFVRLSKKDWNSYYPTFTEANLCYTLSKSWYEPHPSPRIAWTFLIRSDTSISPCTRR